MFTFDAVFLYSMTMFKR